HSSSSQLTLPDVARSFDDGLRTCSLPGNTTTTSLWISEHCVGAVLHRGAFPAKTRCAIKAREQGQFPHVQPSLPGDCGATNHACKTAPGSITHGRPVAVHVPSGCRRCGRVPAARTG